MKLSVEGVVYFYCENPIFRFDYSDFFCYYSLTCKYVVLSEARENGISIIFAKKCIMELDSHQIDFLLKRIAPGHFKGVYACNDELSMFWHICIDTCVYLSFVSVMYWCCIYLILRLCGPVACEVK